MKPIRNSAKAIIIQGGKLLATKNEDHMGIFYLLPSGGQESGETIFHSQITGIGVPEVIRISAYRGKPQEFRI